MTWDDLQNLPPEELVEYVQMRNDLDFADAAKSAFHVLVSRYQEGLLKRLIPVCRNWGYDQGVALEIAEETFAKVWKYPKFGKDKAKQSNTSNAFLFYLFKIAKTQLADYRADLGGFGAPFNGDEQIVYDFPDFENLELPAERRSVILDQYEIIKKALDQLTPKHKIIYLTYKQYEFELNKGHKLPRELLEQLRNTLDLTQSSIRVYKKEAFDTVDRYLKIYGAK